MKQLCRIVCLGAISLFIAFQVAAPNQAFADAAPFPLGKGLSPERRQSRVQMTAERVDIRLGEKLCHVRAHFTFYNPTNAKERLEVGFPSLYENELLSPSLLVDGKGQSFRKAATQKQATGPFKARLLEKPIYTYWLLWNMDFGAKQTRSVEISYDVRPFDNAESISTPYTEHRFAIQREFEAKGWTLGPTALALLQAIDSRSTGYVLRTGAGWDEPIGEAIISVEHPTLGREALRWISPKEATLATPLGFTWEFRNLEPDFDLFIEFNPKVSLSEELRLARTALGERPESDALKSYLAFLSDLQKQLPGSTTLR